MSEDQGVIRRIAWQELCPWLILLRTFRLSISLPVLTLATLGALLTPLGWQLSRILFIGAETGDSYFERVVDENGDWPDLAGRSSAVDAEPRVGSSLAPPLRILNVYTVHRRFTDPFLRIGDLGADTAGSQLTRLAYYLFGGLWNIAVWALLAGAITRIAAVSLGREERVGLRDALGHAARNYVWYLASPLFPLLGAFLVAVPLIALGLLMRLSIGVLLAALLWPLVLVGGLVMAILLFGLLFGWPLMWPAISCEESGDAFEAFSRSYSYTFQRPLHYFFFACVSLIFGGLCWLLVSQFADAVIELPLWVASWGASGERIGLVVGSSAQGLDWLGGGIIQLLNCLVRSTAAGFNYAFFFSSATAIYLLLRREYDRTELDEVFVAEPEEEYGLPPMPDPAAEHVPTQPDDDQS